MTDRFEHQQARTAVHRAVLIGQLPPIKSQQCAQCDRKAEHYHHHNGYDEGHQLDVIPLCSFCHAALDPGTSGLITIRGVSVRLWHRLRIRALEQGMTIGELLNEIIARELGEKKEEGK